MKHQTIFNKKGKDARFPSLAVLGREIFVAFQVTPKSNIITHVDTKSIGIVMKSSDGGRSWTQVCKRLAMAKCSGVQEIVLGSTWDGVLLACWYEWSGWRKHHKDSGHKVSTYGIYVSRYEDGGKSWGDGLHIPGRFQPQYAITHSPIRFGTFRSLRGILLAGHTDRGGGGACSTLFRHWDSGKSWEFLSDIGWDKTGKIDYVEPCLLRIYGGRHILCLMRAEEKEGSPYTVQAHSWDGGQSWTPPKRTNIGGFPAHALQLDDGRVLCTYGRRRKPYGVRACLSYDYGLSWDVENEIVIRDDGAGWDVGYPKSVQLDDGRILTAYYIHTKRGGRCKIEVTIWRVDESLAQLP